MDDLISRQNAINTSLGFFVEFLGGALHEDVQKELIARFQRLPSAQPEVIRCKDCKWHLTYHDEKYNVGYELCSNPMMMSGDSMIDMSNNDFCSKAERRTDE